MRIICTIKTSETGAGSSQIKLHRSLCINAKFITSTSAVAHFFHALPGRRMQILFVLVETLKSVSPSWNSQISICNWLFTPPPLISPILNLYSLFFLLLDSFGEANRRDCDLIVSCPRDLDWIKFTECATSPLVCYNQELSMFKNNSHRSKQCSWKFLNELIIRTNVCEPALCAGRKLPPK